jgi:tetratricopeptide (TPR) repeat protein
MKRRWLTVVLACIALALAIIVGARYLREPMIDWYEDISLALFPSGEKAFAYAERHFSSSRYPEDYDVNRARLLFLQAVHLDPSLLYVHHELARIYFLHSDFVDAMSQIDVQIELYGDTTPNSYYVRGLIEAYMGDYADSANDYAHFLPFDPNDWAPRNDYAWVLLKAGRAKDALPVLAAGLLEYPQNPWLLNSDATALYELGDTQDALSQARKALVALETLTPGQWSGAYPGNDPAIAPEGVAAFKQAVAENIQTILAATSSLGTNPTPSH